MVKAKTLIIYAHPHHKGSSGVTLDYVKEKLHQKGEASILLDLYKRNFNPVLSKEELGTRTSKYISPDTRKLQDLVAKAEKIIIIYPTWWQNQPAILKGFFDKVFIKGFAFDFKNKRPVRLLKGKKAVIFTTTGAPKWVTKIIYGNRSIKTFKHDVLEFCGVKTKAFLVGNADRPTSSVKKQLKKNVKKAMEYLYS